MNLETNPVEMSCFTDWKEKDDRLIFCQVTDSEEAFIYENRLSIEKSLFSEVSSSNSLRSPVDINSLSKSFQKLKNNFWKLFDKEFMWNGWTEGVKVKS